MGGVKDLLYEIEEDMREIHAEVPRPSWEEAMSRLLAAKHQGRAGNTITLGDKQDRSDEEDHSDMDDDGTTWIESVLADTIGQGWDENWDSDCVEEASEGGEEATSKAATPTVGSKREREPEQEAALGRAVFFVEWRLSTTVDSFEDVSHIETSCGDSEEAEEIVKLNVENKLQGMCDYAYRTRASAVAARDAQFEDLLNRARREIKTRLSGKVVKGGPGGKIRVPISTEEYDELKRKEVVMEEMDKEVKGDARQTAGKAPPFGYPFDARGFAIHWGPDTTHHQTRLSRYGPNLGACETLSTEATCTLKMIELEPERAA